MIPDGAAACLIALFKGFRVDVSEEIMIYRIFLQCRRKVVLSSLFTFSTQKKGITMFSEF